MIALRSMKLFLTALLLTGVTISSAHNTTYWGSNIDSLDLLKYKSASGQIKPVKNLSDWQKKREQILENMQLVMGKLPDRSDLPPLDIKVIDSLRESDHTRYEIRFTVAKNEDLTAYLFVPHQKGKPKKFPAMLVLHGTNNLGKQVVSGGSTKPNRAYAKELVQRGYVTIAPDYPSFGGSLNYDFEKDRYKSGTMRAIFDNMRCVDLLQARNDVQAENIGVIGHSLGGHNAMFTAAFDTRLKVVVASCGWTLFENYNIGETASKKYGGKLGPWAQTRYMPLARDKFNLDSRKIPFDFDEVIAAIAPRHFFSNSPVGDSNFDVTGVKNGIANVTRVYQFHRAVDNIQVRYPDAGHDFPRPERLQAYRFIDKVFDYTPRKHDLLF